MGRITCAEIYSSYCSGVYESTSSAEYGSTGSSGTSGNILMASSRLPFISSLPFILVIKASCLCFTLTSLLSISLRLDTEDLAMTVPFSVNNQYVIDCPTFDATPSHQPKHTSCSGKETFSLYHIHSNHPWCAYSEISGVRQVIRSSGVLVFRKVISSTVRLRTLDAHSKA